MVAKSNSKKRVVGIPYIHVHPIGYRKWEVHTVALRALNKLVKICGDVQRKNEQVIDRSGLTFVS